MAEDIGAFAEAVSKSDAVLDRLLSPGWCNNEVGEKVIQRHAATYRDDQSVEYSVENIFSALRTFASPWGNTGSVFQMEGNLWANKQRHTTERVAVSCCAIR